MGDARSSQAEMAVGSSIIEVQTYEASFHHLEGRLRRTTAEDAPQHAAGALTLQLYVVACDGEAVAVTAAQAGRLPLKALHGEPSWECGGCRSKGWSQARAHVCIMCLTTAPMAAAVLEERKHSHRKQGCAPPSCSVLCQHACLHTLMHVHLHLFSCTYAPALCTYAPVHLCTCAPMHLHLCTYAHMHLPLCTCTMHLHSWTCTYALAPVHLHLCTCT